MPYTMGMNNAAQTVGRYSVNITSVGYSVTYTVTRQVGDAKARTLATGREATRPLALREVRRAVRNARRCGGL